MTRSDSRPAQEREPRYRSADDRLKHPADGTHRLRVGVLAVWLAAIAVLGTDRLAEWVTENRLASRIQSTEHLERRPHVSIGGFPFITQVVEGRYGTVRITSRDPITAAGIQIDHVNATLKSVHVSAADAFNGTVPNLPVKSGRGGGVIPYTSLTSAVKEYGGSAGSYISVAAAGRGRARLVGPLGLSIIVTAKVSGGKLFITPARADLQALPHSVSGQVTTALSRPIPLPKFPFNVKLASGEFEPDGLHLAATSHDSTFPVR